MNPTDRNKYILKNIIKYSKIVFLILFTIPIYLLSNIKSQAEEKPEFHSQTNRWQKLVSDENSNYPIIWEKYDGDEIKEENLLIKEVKRLRKYSKFNSFNRSIVFDDYLVGPDISWLVPPGLRWSRSFTVDGSVRGHSRRKKGEDFLKWNGGDAVGQFYYQFKHSNKYSYGLNIGMRSVYQGAGSGGSSPIGEGLSSGLRWDYQLSKNSGFALGGEQIIHFDNLTDTGRDFYFTISKFINQKKNTKIFLFTS